MAKKEVKSPKEMMVDSWLNLPQLTNSESQILNLITDEFLTIKQITLKLNISKQYVYRVLHSIKKKGYLNQGLQKVDKSQCTSQPNRLHGQEFNIRIINKSQKYLDNLKKSNLLIKSGHTIRLYNNSIEIYAGEGISFYGSTEQEATSKSLVYWKKFIVGLENDYKIILLKDRVMNIRLVNQHYAIINSKICKNAIENKKRYKVFADEDGKLCFITDDSFGLKEDETVHPETAKQDREYINNFINDLRHNPSTFSQVYEAMNKMLEVQAMYSENMVSHVKAIQELGEAVHELRKEIKKARNIKEDHTINKSLFDF